MDIPVLVEKVCGNGFRAEGTPPFAYSAEGATRAEAIQKLQQLIQARLAAGAELSVVTVESGPNPWLRLAGVYENDPYLADYEQAIADHRQQVEDDLKRP